MENQNLKSTKGSYHGTFTLYFTQNAVNLTTILNPSIAKEDENKGMSQSADRNCEKKSFVVGFCDVISIPGMDSQKN